MLILEVKSTPEKMCKRSAKHEKYTFVGMDSCWNPERSPGPVLFRVLWKWNSNKCKISVKRCKWCVTHSLVRGGGAIFLETGSQPFNNIFLILKYTLISRLDGWNDEIFGMPLRDWFQCVNDIATCLHVPNFSMLASLAGHGWNRCLLIFS